MSAELKFSLVCIMVVLLSIAIILSAVCRRLVEIRDRLPKAEKSGEGDPDSPERSQAEKDAEKRFTEGIYNILNYNSREGMGN